MFCRLTSAEWESKDDFWNVLSSTGLVAPGCSEVHRITDREAEVTIRGILEQAFPDYDIRGEETGGGHICDDSHRHLWLIDPNDGTTAFGRGWRRSVWVWMLS